jgi:hypothetical protein
LQWELPVLGGGDRKFYVEVKATYPGDAEARKIVRFMEKVPKVLILALGDHCPQPR